ncbi:MAG: lipoyl domain-containing protein [Acidobacteria bacterium]|nr:lipoyl domain-containing protein [Acidobacteriota bacterium]MCI0722028.1 lipoyl domain-containing protein [Acidobacteriota bacterium]
MASLVQVLIPKMGMDTTEVQIGRWLVKAGDSVAPGAPLVELESEKAVFTVEAEIAAKVKEILQPMGKIAAIGDALCTLEKT